MDLTTARLVYADTLKEIQRLVDYAHRLVEDDILNNGDLVRLVPEQVLAIQPLALILQAAQKMGDRVTASHEHPEGCKSL